MVLPIRQTYTAYSSILTLLTKRTATCIIQQYRLYTLQRNKKLKKKMKKYLLYKYGKMGLHLKGEKIKAFKFTIVGIFTLLQQSQM